MSLIQDALKRRQSELRDQMNQPPVPVPPPGSPPPLPGERLKAPPPATIPNQAKKVAKKQGIPPALLVVMGVVGVSALVGAWWYLNQPDDITPPPPLVTNPPPTTPPKTPLTDVVNAVDDMTNKVIQKNEDIEVVSSSPFQFAPDEEQELLELANTFDAATPPDAGGSETNPPPPRTDPETLQVDATGHARNNLETGHSTPRTLLPGQWPTMKIMGIVADKGGNVGQVIIDSNIFTAGRTYKGVLIERIEPNYVELNYKGDVERFVAGEDTGNR